jgi:hypothetical protein
MKTLIASVFAIALLGTTAANAAISIGIGVGGHDHHRHRVCEFHHHHRTCFYR